MRFVRDWYARKCGFDSRYRGFVIMLAKLGRHVDGADGEVFFHRRKHLEHDSRVIRKFIAVYCRENHGRPSGELFPECDDLLQYALQRLARCPMDPKPKCKACPVHCYRPDYRKRIQQVMRLSGMYLIKRGRLDWLVRYFL